MMNETDKKITDPNKQPIKAGQMDTSDGTKPIRLWDFLRTLTPSRAYLAIKRRYGNPIYEGMVPEHGDPKDLYKKEWDALLADERTKRMQVIRVYPYGSNYGQDLYLDIEVEGIEDNEEDYL